MSILNTLMVYRKRLVECRLLLAEIYTVLLVERPELAEKVDKLLTELKG